MNIGRKSTQRGEPSRTDTAIVSVAIAVAVLGTMMSIHSAAQGGRDAMDSSAESTTGVATPMPGAPEVDPSVPRARDAFKLHPPGDWTDPIATF